MNESEVTRDGSRGARPGRQAPGGQRPEQGGRRRRRRGEQLLVPKAEFRSYYGRPILNRPGWKASNIAGYFFLGGLAGAGSVLAAGAELTGRPRTARAMKISSLAAVTGSTAALVHDLGRPSRFANMLRVLKPTSPMSVGSWILAAYGPAAGAAAALDVLRRLPRLGRAATVSAALLGPAVASYTAVLAADTAVPGWHEGYRELPYVFTGSATAAAAGMALIAAPATEAGPARATAVFGAALETAAVKAMERRLGMVAEVYRTGPAGRLMRVAEGLTLAGAAGAALNRRGDRMLAALSGTALLAASACTRFGVFHAGMASIADPRYTVVPQRERLRRREAEAGRRGAGAAEGDPPGGGGAQSGATPS
ncbi:NrfD/PsrC family molybdoenzyme membrane anchor subunit [Streptomyces sp. NPDC059740]|uniref:NrfD/PsrC family molybdoenzyme membrane anchor subunit n=1 Tax=Streptomyces sp. NPDC059740 TaxID=3346926 RepID=UPI00365FEF1A